MSFAYQRLGLSERAALAVIALTLIGWFDIPVARLRGSRHPTTGVVRI